MSTANLGIERLQEAAHHADAEEKAALAISAAKTRLIVDPSGKGCFFGTLASKLLYSPSWDIETAGVDGTTLIYNPDFINGNTWQENIGVLCHESMHCANKHFLRMKSRDPATFNLAADLSINQLIIECGFKLPKKGAFVGQGPFAKMARGLSAEEYYELLRQEQPEGESEECNDPGGCGGFSTPANGDGKQLSDAQERQLDQSWTAAVASAQQAASRRGDLPGGLQRLCDKTLENKVDWRRALREFVTRPAKRDYNWRRPNRRFAHAGLYLPSMNSLEIGNVVAMIDVSGSCVRHLPVFGGELIDVMRQGVGKLTVVYFDTDVCRVDEFSTDDEITFHPVGGGGTSNLWMNDWIAALEEPPSVVICLTDLQSSFPKEAPDCPVLWASVSEHDAHPWGERIDIPLE